ncbi:MULTISPECIES: GNAT family N-acetyltransferase [Rhizobium]|uniref:GNAT family N-acetyltransferase n=1 Tax=Rhizobium rhododendri TaxID=2506430 RepID=A0ABY8IIL0_9HYPH|nr:MULTISPECIES: GNAT family N-acetyltransferase [Rhizobium]MBO9097755.1 GNAT family N-acetyltransferase [Rhizobium sp. L58/93]MBO9133462.1 GNAT family N-acetyltransferase [Rhizobium sp. B209b/85]MBO9167905.1 GNAT family N-acetyltransferase [Rhizobium sp. L245/93]MBO9183950.1 GNAT family N-acetyltransferase [Rhizobium sp. E27B/91]MBZ5761640.1 GNAT family N-acetyltransferase [Rhizobium sp. VS19-DR96]
MLEDSEISLLRPPVLTIRAARREDLPDLNAMITLLAAHHGDAAATTPEQLERDLFGPLPWITALVADSAEGLLGYAILVPLYRAQEGQRGMDLHHLFVRDGHRGHGIGQHLVDRARETARKAGCRYLSVSAATGNVAAHRFYEQLDFTPRPVTGMRYLQALG